MNPTEHPSWPALTDEQRRAVNEVWDDVVVPALERAENAQRECDARVLSMQDRLDWASVAIRDAQAERVRLERRIWAWEAA